jgi:hypothetical protein
MWEIETPSLSEIGARIAGLGGTESGTEWCPAAWHHGLGLGLGLGVAAVVEGR